MYSNCFTYVVRSYQSTLKKPMGIIGVALWMQKMEFKAANPHLRKMPWSYGPMRVCGQMAN